MEIIKLKIDLTAMTFEFEGSKEFAKEALAEFLSARPHSAAARPKGGHEHQDTEKTFEPVPEAGEEANGKPKKGGRKPNRSVKESYSLPKDLDLSGRGMGIPSLEDFYTEKKPSNAQEMNAVFVYYLERMMKLESINPDQVYACYKQVKAKLPTRLKQSLVDTSNRKAWIDTSKLDNLKVAVPGENFVEHDLPKKEKTAK